jgi:hypothetical protein
MPRYTEAVLDLALRQGFERKKQEATEARRQQRQERIQQLLTQVQTQTQQQGSTPSGAPLSTQPATGAVAELSTYGANLPAQYTQPLVDVSKVPVPPEVKDAYNNRVISFQQLYQFRDKRVRMSDEEMKFLWENDDRVQAAFPLGPKQLKATQSFVGAFGKELGAQVFGKEKPSALSEKLRYADTLLKNSSGRALSTEELLADPVRLGKLDIIGLTLDDLSEHRGLDPQAVAKIEQNIRDKIIQLEPEMKWDFGKILEQWRADRLEDRYQKFVPTLTMFYNKETGQLKSSVTLLEKERIDNLALTSANIKSAPPDLKPVLLYFIGKDQTTAAQIDAEIKALEAIQPNEDLWPTVDGIKLTRKLLERVKKSFGK